MDTTTDRIAYSVKEAAAALGVSAWTIREEIRTGRLESVRLGSRILIPRRELERLVQTPDVSEETTKSVSDAGNTEINGAQG